jgi:lipid A 3-O-deacylase
MRRRTRSCCRLFTTAVSAVLCTGAHAFNLGPDAVSFEGGAGTHRATILSAGLTWDWDFESLRRKSELTAHTELLVNHWRADAIGGGRQSFTQLAVLPSLRMRLERGASPWYIELGIGVSWLDRPFVTPAKTFSTQWNFLDVMGLGYTLGGPDGKQEIGLRWSHTSNAGLKKPNPGQDFLQLRLVQRF